MNRRAWLVGLFALLAFGQTLAYPLRTTAGFTSRPDAVTSINFNYYQQNGDPAITSNANGAFGYVQRLHGLQPLTGRQGYDRRR